MVDIAVSDVDRDLKSSQKASLIGMHRGSSLHGYYPKGTIVSDNSVSLKGVEARSGSKNRNQSEAE